MTSLNSDQKKPEKPELQPSPEETSGAQVSLVRKIIIGLFIAGFWVFFYWFREP